MSSIREVEIDRRDEVSEMVGEFVQTMDEKHRPGADLMDLVLSYGSESNIKILGKFGDDGQILGIAVLSLTTNRLSFIHVRALSGFVQDEIQRHKIETELFDSGFERLKGYESWVLTGGSIWLTENLLEHALKLGFKQHDQIGMEVSRNEYKELRMPSVHAGYTLENYDDKWKEKIARVFYESFKDSPSVRAEPDSLSTQEKCLTMINDTIASRWGDFKDGRYSWVLKFGDEIVGAALFTIMKGTIGFGVGMCILPLHRRKGLGRWMFTHSWRCILESEPEVIKMGLATLADNPARHLCESVGFKETSRTTLYTWVKDPN